MKKIVIISKSIDGGTGTFVINLFHVQPLLGKNYSLKAYIFEKPKFRNIKNKKFIFLHKKGFYPDKYSLINSFRYFIDDLLLLKSMWYKERPDLIISVNYYTNILVALSKIIFLIKEEIILTYHNNFLLILKKRCSLFIRQLLGLIFPYLFRTATNVSVSQSLAHELRSFMKLKDIAIIPNGVDTKIFIKKSIKQREVISVGRFDEQKDYFTLLNAFAILNKKISDSHLTLIGDGKDYHKISRYIKKLRLGKKIILLKWKHNIGKYLKKSDLFVFSSNYEGFPYTIIEAMSYGLPIIATDTPYGPKEILDHGKYGYLVPMKNPIEMAKYMNIIFANKKTYRYFSKKSLDRAQYFSQDRMLQSYKKIINKVI